MMKFCFLILLLLSMPAVAAEPVNRQPEGKEVPKQTLPVTEQEKVARPQKKPSTLKSFTPSEKIAADAVVTFPVDI
ncbi:MAG: hypothetical protein U9R66_00990 [Thermodesulfobacteriota bacterium]|nr:hypothetical protein [Thermodesulfobacteriota bacterium]